MKRTIICIITIMLSSNFFLLEAAVVKNMLKQRITLNLKSGKVVELLSGETATIPDSELNTPSVEQHVKRGDITIIKETPVLKKK